MSHVLKKCCRALDLLPIEGLGISLGSLRLFRVLRVLRTITKFPELRAIVMIIGSSLPVVGDVMALLLLIFFSFGILGVQLYRGALRGRCFDIERYIATFAYMHPTSDSILGAQTLPVRSPLKHITSYHLCFISTQLSDLLARLHSGTFYHSKWRECIRRRVWIRICRQCDRSTLVSKGMGY
jgi:hypothetical protein